MNDDEIKTPAERLQERLAKAKERIAYLESGHSIYNLCKKTGINESNIKRTLEKDIELLNRYTGSSYSYVQFTAKYRNAHEDVKPQPVTMDDLMSEVNLIKTQINLVLDILTGGNKNG